jgi:hypothetical protein
MSPKHVVPLVVALALVGVLSGCSKDTIPTGPAARNPAPTLDQSPPALPAEITAETDGRSGLAVLHWTPSSSANVASYRIYVYSPDPTRENAYLLAGETNATTTQFVLRWTETGTPYYRMCANSTAGVQSRWSTPIQLPLGDAVGGDPSPEGEILRTKP